MCVCVCMCVCFFPKLTLACPRNASKSVRGYPVFNAPTSRGSTTLYIAVFCMPVSPWSSHLTTPSKDWRTQSASKSRFPVHFSEQGRTHLTYLLEVLPGMFYMTREPKSSKFEDERRGPKTDWKLPISPQVSSIAGARGKEDVSTTDRPNPALYWISFLLPWVPTIYPIPLLVESAFDSAMHTDLKNCSWCVSGAVLFATCTFPGA